MKKAEIKQWIKEHKTEIKIAVESTAGLALVGFGCYKLGEVHAMPWDSKSRKFIRDTVCCELKGGHGLSSFTSKTGLRADSLGALSEALIDGTTVTGDTVYNRILLVADKPFKNI